MTHHQAPALCVLAAATGRGYKPTSTQAGPMAPRYRPASFGPKHKTATQGQVSHRRHPGPNDFRGTAEGMHTQAANSNNTSNSQEMWHRLYSRASSACMVPTPEAAATWKAAHTNTSDAAAAPTIGTNLRRQTYCDLQLTTHMGPPILQ